jgi:pimeloyl-ACP methyl ester carboxylesterase
MPKVISEVPMKNLLSQLEGLYSWYSLQVDGHEWRWIDTAPRSGPTAILLPGSVGDGAMFVRTLLSLGTRMRLIAVTYPALSDPESLAHGLAAVAKYLALQPCLVVGSSFAAYWAQFYALHYPENVRALILGNGFVDQQDLADNLMFNQNHIESVSAEALHGQWLDRVRGAPASPLQQLQEIMLSERQPPDNLQARFLGVVRSQACPALSLPDSVVTVLDCDDDPLIPAAAQERLRGQYPGARHVSLPKGGHYPHLLNPKAYEALLFAS